MGEHFDQVLQDGELSRGIEIEVQLNVELAGVDAKGHSRQDDDLGVLLPSDAGRSRDDLVALHHIGRIRQVVIVRFRRPPRENRDLVRGVLYGLPIGLGEDVRSAGHIHSFTM